jgi:hypothetical protein
MSASTAPLTATSAPVGNGGSKQRDLEIDHEVLAPSALTDLAEVERRYEQTAVPFGWRFTRADLDDLLRRLGKKRSSSPTQSTAGMCFSEIQPEDRPWAGAGGQSLFIRPLA